MPRRQTGDDPRLPIPRPDATTRRRVRPDTVVVLEHHPRLAASRTGPGPLVMATAEIDLEQLREAAAAGQSDVALATRWGVSARTILRWRKRHGIPSTWAPTAPALHSNRARCPCADCRQVTRDRLSASFRAAQASTVPTARRSGHPWSPAEDEYLMTSTRDNATTARELGRTYAALLQRRVTLRRRG